MRKPQIEEAYARQEPLFHSRYKDWENGISSTKVTLVSSRHTHWMYNRVTDKYEARTNAVKYGGFGTRTSTGYLVRDEAGNERIVTAMQLRGTWEDCQKTIADNKAAAKKAAQLDTERRIAFDEVIEDIGAFGLTVQSWSVGTKNVIVSGPALLALLRELQKGPQG